MLSREQKERSQSEIICIDDLVPRDHLLRKIEYRWFLGYSLTEKTPHFSTFSYNFSHRFT